MQPAEFRLPVGRNWWKHPQVDAAVWPGTSFPSGHDTAGQLVHCEKLESSLLQREAAACVQKINQRGSFATWR